MTAGLTVIFQRSWTPVQKKTVLRLMCF